MRRIVFEPGPGRQDIGRLHESNARAVLTAIASAPGATAADAARVTGLSPSTVARLLGELSTRGLVLEGKRVRGRRGQPGISLSMNPMGALSAGCQIGRQEGYLFIRALGGAVLAESTFAVDSSDPTGLVESVAAAFGDLSRKLAVGSPPVVGLGVALAADLAARTASTTAAADPSRDEGGFARDLAHRIGVPVSVYAAATAGAWAELAATPPPRPADYLYIFVDDRVQSGFLLDGRLWVPPRHRQGSLGYMVLGSAGDQQRLDDLVDAAKLGNAPPETTLQALAGPLARATHAVVDTLALPLVIIDGAWPEERLAALVERLSHDLAVLCRVEAPVVRRGRAGARAPAKGAALRPLYMAFFAAEAG